MSAETTTTIECELCADTYEITWAWDDPTDRTTMELAEQARDYAADMHQWACDTWPNGVVVDLCPSCAANVERGLPEEDESR